MGRVVVVSNRLADPRKAAAGGLAVALGETLNATGGLWFGWSGKIVETSDGGTPGEGEVHTHQAGNVTLVTVDLSREDHDSYYLGYSNRVLWPVFHYRLDLADFNTSSLAGYRRVNQMFARKLMPLLKDDDILWVHDYHLIPLAAELRAMGCRNRIGFFLHIPLPPPLILAALPGHEWLIRALFAYDLVGLQSHADVSHFSRYVQSEAGAEELGDDLWRAFNRTLRVSAFPIGIDVDEFARLTQGKDARETYETMREQYSRRRLLIGIDRLDYSKGLPQRIRAFQELLASYPENRDSATLIQIASPTRESVDAYADIRHELEHLCGQINGDYGELDWMPVRYIHRTVARKRLPGLCRIGRVALVTPLRDGMNLVAKEYIAAQDPADPGVLVLSRFAGAAEQLREALLVNPYDVQGTAQAIQQALQMPLEERQTRHRKLLESIRTHDVHWWRRSFLTALEKVPA
ncbi:alpha,alpha-trehalose-phosphate synthase (UDP-forming) [Aquabacterium sp. A7-Y]|uniref:alpha,alpha-trehalose-phosphate synthase (UDP-forming) n=1 Tax=Aquabacterium sp. A7-Y TaxID=1349605 RepID=UPI00223D7E2B|nr:alpha,alpha-trehalose-phosphate synthase (UDP-forming) [Aquabacterium sp. A7-Y]MCW7538373.1 alpha,alpha-trehalose-phosphate synthase (UDP-forming) [Aquabacterium sp. A7-Y]